MSLDDYQSQTKNLTPSNEEVKITVEVELPPPFVRTIKELIYWEYARLMTKAAGNGVKSYWGFTTANYKKLLSGSIKMTDLDHDNRKQINREPHCEYCGKTKAEGAVLSQDHIIPMSKLRHEGADNIITSCRECNSSKGDRDVFDWYYNVRKETDIPKMVWSKYLKLALNFHTAFNTLNSNDLNGDGKLDVLDLGSIFKKYSR